MSENAISLFVTIGLLALTAAWVPFLESVQRGLREMIATNPTEPESEPWMEAAPELEL